MRWQSFVEHDACFEAMLQRHVSYRVPAFSISQTTIQGAVLYISSKCPFMCNTLPGLFKVMSELTQNFLMKLNPWFFFPVLLFLSIEKMMRECSREILILGRANEMTNAIF